MDVFNELNGEKWLPVNGGEGRYLISSFGRLWGIRKKRFIKPYCNEWGYFSYGSIDNFGKRKCWLLHRLVGIAFIPNPDKKSEINHINGIKTDNKIDNLEWVTSKENRAHALHKLGVNMGFGYIRVRPVIASNDREEIYFFSISDAGECGYNKVHITNCCKKRTSYKTHHGLKWKYASNERVESRKQRRKP